ncbi:hypothetical protein EJ377_00410 [Chryseobacterium arthrosphaerae]|uniref:Uncharacterized protein n=1 Tax=Chryseobacterium arthrosphaerae TaxID=651561 RepID=A0A3S0NNC1_9FLAO|nr:hypothetical protein EJ377_00410 [Chryseobacterium arthrosphaerae]
MMEVPTFHWCMPISTLLFSTQKHKPVCNGNDGGIFFAPDKNNLASTTAIGMRNKRFNVTHSTGTLNPSLHLPMKI